MEDRVRRALDEAGVDSAPPGAAHRVAMRRRHDVLGDEDDPRYLHPGRTVLVVVQDFGERDPTWLTAAALFESRDPELKVGIEEARAGGVGAAVLERVAELPRPQWGTPGAVTSEGTEPDPGAGALDDDALVEALVVGELPVVRLVLAEALDHLRHAHLWSDPAARLRAAVLGADVLEPVARRRGGTPSRRYGWWARRVAPGLRGG